MPYTGAARAGVKVIRWCTKIEGDLWSAKIVFQHTWHIRYECSWFWSYFFFDCTNKNSTLIDQGDNCWARLWKCKKALEGGGENRSQQTQVLTVSLAFFYLSFVLEVLFSTVMSHINYWSKIISTTLDECLEWYHQFHNLIYCLYTSLWSSSLKSPLSEIWFSPLLPQNMSA